MLTNYGPTFCLACHRVMMEPAPVCPRCGAEQADTREALIARLQAPPPRRRAPWVRREPPLPLNAVDNVACPTCRVPVPAGAPSCSYCGHTMLTDLPKWTPDDALARRYLFTGIACCALGLLGLISGGAFFMVGGLLLMGGMVLGMTGFGHNPLGWTETFLLGFVLVLGMAAVILMFVTMFAGVG